MTDSIITSEVDFDAPGKQTGYLRLPHSTHRSAYGWIPIPVACVANGDGPTALLLAGNHGEEYEGQVILSNLIRDLAPDDVAGRIIILPMANFPAAAAGRRTSPIDDGNLNRRFPGDPTGGVTDVIAHFIEEVLAPRADILFDLHSGGSSLTYLPTAFLAAPPDDTQRTDRRALLQAFGLPFGLFYESDPTTTFSSGAAARKGLTSVMTELGGGGAVTPSVLRLAEDGLKRALALLGVYRGPTPPPADGPPARILDEDTEQLVYADEPGLFEPLVELGDEVEPGASAARIHHVETPGRPPTEVAFEAGGLVLCKRVPARVERGDCLFHTAAVAG